MIETATAAAGQILDQLGDGDQTALLPSCGPAIPGAGKLDRTHSYMFADRLGFAAAADKQMVDHSALDPVDEMLKTADDQTRIVGLLSAARE